MDNGEVKQFKKGTDTNEILKKLKIRSRDFYFFQNNAEYADQAAETDLELK